MKHELPKAYDFKSTEPRVYALWETGGYFKPWNDPNKKGFDPNVKPFVISIPPPNVTGELHLGHAMFVSVEDLMTRYHRMKGIPTLWVPGSDHAGIATQLMVERHLLKTEEVTREELGREVLALPVAQRHLCDPVDGIVRRYIIDSYAEDPDAAQRCRSGFGCAPGRKLPINPRGERWLFPCRR